MTAPPVPSRFLYASGVGGPNANPAAIYGFAVYPSGATRLIPGSAIGTDSGGGQSPAAGLAR